MIQVAAQLLRTSVISAAVRRPARSAAAVPSRMPMSAARSPRVICGAWSIARYSAGQQRAAPTARAPRRAAPRTALFGSIASACADTPSRASSNSPRASSSSPICASDPASAGSSSTALRKCSSASVGVALLPLDAGQLAVEERAVGRARDRRRVRLRRLVEPAGSRRVARACKPLLDCPEPQHFDAPRQIGQRRIDGERRLERGERVALAIQREQRLAAADQRRHIVVLRAELERAVEMRQRRLRVLARQLDVAERGFGRIERRLCLQRRRELALGVPEIAGLQERPAARFAACRQAVPASAGGTAGRMNSGNFGAVTTGTGASFGAHALRQHDRDQQTPSHHGHFIPRSQAGHGPTSARAMRATGAGRRRRSTPGRRASRAARRGRGDRRGRCARDRPHRRDRRSA